MTLSTNGLAYDVELHEHPLHFFDAEPLRVVRGIVFDLRNLALTVHEILVVIEVAGIGRDPVVTAEIFGPNHFLARHQRFVELLAVTRPDDPDRMVVPGDDLADGPGEVADGRGRGLLNKDVAGP